MSATQILHAHLGRPKDPDCGPVDPEPCWMCAGADVTRGMPTDKWQGSSFVGQNRVRRPASHVVCEACVYFCARSSPVPGRPPKEGKAFGGNFRNYSHLWSEESGYVNASKGDKPIALAWLRAQKTGRWFAALADSGQKHVLPWAPVNHGPRGFALFDEQLVQIGDWELVDRMVALLTAGATKEELERGAYGPRAYDMCGSDLGRFEREHGARRGGAWFALCVFLAQRDEAEVATRLEREKVERAAKKEKHATQRRAVRTPANQDGGAVTRPAGRVSAKPRRERAEKLGGAPDTQPTGRASRDERGRVGDDRAPNPPARAAEQMDLFGVARPERRGARARRPA